MENIHELKAQLASPKDIVIISHRNPDGDAIGSSLGLYHYLLSQGHAVHVVLPSEYPDAFLWMPGIQNIIVFDSDQERTREVCERAQIIFCLDFNSLDRIDKVGEIIQPLNSVKVLIDHHLYPEPFADYVMSDTTASSTAEMVFDFIVLMGHRPDISRATADCVYTGIVTDTGSFKFSTSPKLFRIVAELLELGVDDYKLQDLIFNSLDEKQLRLLGHCLYNRMEILPEYRTGIITLTKEDYEHFDIVRGETEGIVNYLLKMRDITMAAFITEQPSIVKISLRSKGDFSVQDICRKHFKGGGHRNASGGFSFQPLKVTLRKFKELLPEYKDALNNY
ncbi:MAG: bifunctional oligoribonuclease/PAP phosphatase NrnA [Saprospiraceae bacterium]|nr:bifunctional oligoribonuclease/PAP phosphatase NrnA [Saprospiraceae bacterium]HRD80089.1 bifunctional oligoribonuclease/PAP phosphatase NrnA [Saprospiraceae bacterium]HRF41727.1 bifunctional oligoribonuclease/PAP phosphatase NrnA [Saprospiraceae bacterium]HRK82935.1 bifunctional oligoribonuclease/PAP phosphatase NrnA [Saprospiraceae bacterium]